MSNTAKKTKPSRGGRVMFAARLAPSEIEYIKDAAYDGRKRNQDILSEAIALHRQTFGEPVVTRK